MEQFHQDAELGIYEVRHGPIEDGIQKPDTGAVFAAGGTSWIAWVAVMFADPR